MGRHNGSWAKFHPQMNDHEKTARAARVLIEGGVAPEYAAPVVILSVLRLAAWALGDGDTGETTTLLDGRLAGIAWPEAVESKRTAIAVPTRVGALLRAALRTAGFLDHDGKAEWIHDFVEVYLEVINRRRKVRRLPPIVPEQLRNNRRGNASISPELFRLCHVPGGSGSGSGSGRGGAEPPPGVASRPADPDPDREAAEAIADALNEDIDLVRQVLRELALKGIPANRAAQVALELPGPIGAWDFKAHALKVAQPPKPAAPDYGARPPSDGRGLAASRDQAAEAERIRAEFAASGYVDRNAWNADRRAGQVRTGPAAALRRFDVSTLAVVDVHPNAVGA